MEEVRRVKNLADVVSNSDKKKVIAYELERCSIPRVRVPTPGNNRAFEMIGQLGSFKFTRYAIHWAVTGLMPMEIADELEADPVGKDDIHVVGHPLCGWHGLWPSLRYAPHLLVPEELPYLTDEDKQALQEFAQTYVSWEVPDGWYAVPPDRAKSLGARPYITGYRIDSEVGLRVFAETLFKHQLAAEPKRPKPELVAA
jgi:hypothetical protein